MSYGLFTDKQTQPSPNEINEALGTVRAQWTSLLEFLRLHYRSQEDFKFLYGNNYGWALRFRTKEKLLTALFPNRDHFVSLVILGGKQLKAVESLKLHSNACKAIESANLRKEGKWLFVKVYGRNDVKDIEALLELKVEKRKAEVQLAGRKRAA